MTGEKRKLVFLLGYHKQLVDMIELDQLIKYRNAAPRTRGLRNGKVTHKGTEKWEQYRTKFFESTTGVCICTARTRHSVDEIIYAHLALMVITEMIIFARQGLMGRY